jgi:hypothetical protein
MRWRETTVIENRAGDYKKDSQKSYVVKGFSRGGRTSFVYKSIKYPSAEFRVPVPKHPHTDLHAGGRSTPPFWFVSKYETWSVLIAKVSKTVAYISLLTSSKVAGSHAN